MSNSLYIALRDASTGLARPNQLKLVGLLCIREVPFQPRDFFPKPFNDVCLAYLETILVVCDIFALRLLTANAACPARLCSVTLGRGSACLLPTDHCGL